MIGNTLLVFDDFDPISNYKLALIQESLNVEKSIVNVVFLYHPYKQGDTVFTQEEKMALISASTPNLLSPKYLIDGESFSDVKLTFVKKLSERIQKNKGFYTYLLLDSLEYQILESTEDWPYIYSSVQIIIYIRPEHEELRHSYSFTVKNLIFINSSPELANLTQASVLNVFYDSHPKVVIDYMNKSGECAIKRIKPHLSDSRFKHCLRVAGTIKHIMELTEVSDSELRYDAYLAAIYHDICKELAPQQQKQIAESELGLTDYVSWKVLHGPIGAWYMRKKYLFDNDDILEAVSKHTIPGENPKDIVIYIYLADRLEINKKSRYPEEVYLKTWEYIEQKRIYDAFNYLLLFFEDLKKKSNNPNIF